MEKKAIVYMPDHCYNRMIKHIFENPRYECGGFLIGNRIDLDDAYVFSTREIYYEPHVGTHSRFEFSLDNTENAMDFESEWNERNKSDDYLFGTYHSHGTFDAFHSNVDDIYAKKFNLMIICSPSTKRIEVWYWNPGLSRWFEGSLIVYSDDGKTPEKNITVLSEETTVTSGTELFPMRTYKKKKTSKPRKKALIIGCGTLGNLLAQHFIDGNPGAEITFVDRDYYEVANLPRSPVIESDAVGKPKAFALAEAVAKASHNLYPVHGIVGDIRKFSINFFEQFDVIISPLDNLECRYYLSYCASVLRKPFVNLGTSYVGINGTPSFSGDVYYKPRRSNACLDCFYPLFKSNEALLSKRVSCGGELPEEVAPQVISSSMLIASVAFVCIKKALANDNATFSSGYNISDVFSSEDFYDKAPVRISHCCSFRSMHEFKSPIKTISISPQTHFKTLYKCIKAIFKDHEDCEYEIDMVSSGLTHLKYRRINPIHSICLDKDCIGKIHHLIGTEYFPRDHVYAISSKGRTRYIRIKLK